MAFSEIDNGGEIGGGGGWCNIDGPDAVIDSSSVSIDPSIFPGARLSLGRAPSSSPHQLEASVVVSGVLISMLLLSLMLSIFLSERGMFPGSSAGESLGGDWLLRTTESRLLLSSMISATLMTEDDTRPSPLLLGSIKYPCLAGLS